MKRLSAICLILCILSGVSFASANDSPQSGTIQRHLPALDIASMLQHIPLEERLSPKEGNFADLRGADLSGMDLSPYADALRSADFDSQTVWPGTLPEGFDPQLLMALGMDPGRGVGTLHERGLTGKNIGIAIIDQTLLVDHQEYADRVRLYEESSAYANRPAVMHGSAVASIALGETVGVAPDALLYYIAEESAVYYDDGSWERDCTKYAAAIERFIELNQTLPENEKIRVISMSIGWMPDSIGAEALDSAVQKARDSGIAVCAVDGGDPLMGNFGGAGRDPFGDPNEVASVRPGLFWESALYTGSARTDTILVPMDYRCVASPTGADEYVLYASGGMSWAVPYVAGLYALALEAYPDLAFSDFVSAARRTAQQVSIQRDGNSYPYGYALDAVALIDVLADI